MNPSLRRSLVLAAGALLLVAAPPRPARAESGRLNLHVDLALAGPLAGEAGPVEPDNKVHLGGLGHLSLDYQFSAPFAAELILGGGFFPIDFPDPADDNIVYFTAALGGRMRFLDNQEGYGNEQGGDYNGNTWVSLHLGYHKFDGSQFGIDAAVGYEFSVLRPMQIGLFVRGALMFAGDGDELDFLASVGVNFSFELVGGVEAVDSDGDGLSDEREVNRWHTNPNNPDTDGDALNDGLETRTETNPLAADTDSDAAPDGQEDANHDGRVDPTEADPRRADTDGGGAPDGWELSQTRNVRNPADDDQDQDRVADHRDACPGTPPGTEVDERGCAVLRAQMVLTGIEFAFNSAEILPDSASTLERAVQILRDNPDARVEISGHTDNVGNAAYNQRLSEQRASSVRDWLVEHGIEAARLRTRGYGSAQPIADNATEEGRQRNRRIQFNRLDGDAAAPPAGGGRRRRR